MTRLLCKKHGKVLLFFHVNNKEAFTDNGDVTVEPCPECVREAIEKGEKNVMDDPGDYFPGDAERGADRD